ncbi:serine/threonine-protein kinase [Amnibacterium flavum]|uniref:non-specific serine/threonine protein kinase n=1 Tax=Amnibacterium flavum TaxID=2173173 RepID=A0A2V1HZA6_9MICO|nr:serine/threonine-protein kinase [Amnibacterium flavum]PVZ96024.1 serine/threonine protein kinase [Amnibacterium flavum]
MRRAPSTPPELRGYRYLRPLGAGGFSDVFLYEQSLPRRNVAVKVLLTDELNQANRDSFVAEANLMAQLSAHPYIVTIHHAEVTPDDRPYFVMEYCSGASLGERYKTERFEVADVLRIGVRLVGAVATAHASGILHRDIKPGNVLTNDYGWPALTDFGIASTLDELPVHTTTSTRDLDIASTGTAAQSVGLSVPWSPAEMFEDEPDPDVRSDVFSLAATLHTLLAGRTPFEIPGRSNGTLDLIGRIERGAITPIGRDDVPRSLVAVLQKGMALRREDRFASAVDFGRALQRVELELGYAPTTIEVPNLESVRSSTDQGDGAEETHVRSIATIEAQPVAPPQAGPAAAAPETRVREVTSIDPEPAPVEDRTLLRSPTRRDVTPPHDTAVRSVPRDTTETIPGPPVASTAPATAPRRSRGRTLALVGGIAALVLVGAAVTTAVVLRGPSQPEASQTAAPGEDPPDAIVGGGVPTPTDGVAERAADGSSVVFRWSNPDPQDGDTYRWWRSEQPGSTTPTDETVATVAPVEAAQRVCISVVVLRDGKTGDPLEVCS